MKKTLGFMLMPVLACGLAMAQSNMSSDKDKRDQMSGETKTMTGCVSERDGKYWLTDKKHPVGVELMTSEDLKAHIGHKVSVSGVMGPMDQDAAEDAMKKYPERKASTPDNPSRTTKKERREEHEMKEGLQMMNVNSVQMVSEKCKMK